MAGTDQSLSQETTLVALGCGDQGLDVALEVDVVSVGDGTHWEGSWAWWRREDGTDEPGQTWPGSWRA
jgi:hypothetical protein